MKKSFKDEFIENLGKTNSLTEFYNLLNEKNYNQIFNLYGKDVYQLFTPKEYQKKEIKECFEKHDFETLRVKYGKIDNVKVRKFKDVKNPKLEKSSKIKKILAVGLSSLAIFSTVYGLNSNFKNFDDSKNVTIVETDDASSSLSNNSVVEKIDNSDRTNSDNKDNVNEVKKDVESIQTDNNENNNLTDTEIEKNDVLTNDEKMSLLDDTELLTYNLFNEEVEYLENNDQPVDIRNFNDEDLKYSDSCVFYNVAFLSGVALYNEEIKEENISLYNDYLNEYNENLEQYAEYIKSLNLNDMQTISKVMDDVWNSVEDGYGTPKYDIYGLYRIDVDKDNTSAMCRNLADDFAAKMNAINPDYECLTVNGFYDTNLYDKSTYANIGYREYDGQEDLVSHKKVPLTIFFDNNLSDENNNEISYSISNDGYYKKYNLTNQYVVRVNADGTRSDYTGNHTVAMLSIKDEVTHETKYNLIVDPTNCKLGVLYGGKVCMFDGIDYEGFKISAIGTIMNCSLENSEYIANALKYSMDNYEKIDLELMKEMYDIDAINENLNYIRSNIEDNNMKSHIR